MIKFSTPETPIAKRLQITTSQPVSLSIASNMINLNIKTPRLERLYVAYCLKNLLFFPCSVFTCLSQTGKGNKKIKVTYIERNYWSICIQPVLINKADKNQSERAQWCLLCLYLKFKISN